MRIEYKVEQKLKLNEIKRGYKRSVKKDINEVFKEGTKTLA